MSLRRSSPIAFHPRSLSDTLDGSTGSPGAMAVLQNLIPDPSTRNLWQCRPAAIELIDFTAGGNPFSDGFSDGFARTTFPQPAGAVSTLFVIGDMLYGLVALGPELPQLDYPFAYNLKTNVFVDVSGVTTANRPRAPSTTGPWTPPSMDVIGSIVMVTHPGFDGTGGNWFGWFDISNPLLPAWHAGNLGGTAFSGASPGFSATTGAPVAVKAFNGRAYWAFNPPVGASATVFSDVQDPLTINAAAVAGVIPVITYDDNIPITALGALPLQNQFLGGIVQAIIVFKGAVRMYQITGDIALGSGPPLGTLTRNALNINTGTLAPLSIAATPKGLMFVAPDGLRMIDFQANVSDPIGIDGDGKVLPFINAVIPSRIAAAVNGVLYRVSVQDGSLLNSPFVEYWFDFARGGIWSGPHTFASTVIRAYGQTFIMAAHAANGAIWRSDYLQSSSSTYIENGLQMNFIWTTSMLPDTDQMSENALLETTLYMAMSSGSAGTYLVQALNQNRSVLQAANLVNPSLPVFWGAFTWGQSLWGGALASLFPQAVPWPKPVVFRRMQLVLTGVSSSQLRVGTLHMRYEGLGYLQQGIAA
jgi:hypothetical protein